MPWSELQATTGDGRGQAIDDLDNVSLKDCGEGMWQRQ
jgi:hypothetical protein